ncbi:hypothetical protein [Streptomyces luteireticuli]|uniref:hypothetical protein n=1 Tax=Streptomyces luteireticuli TaxID=173858 RepID=UPI003557273D
MSKVIVPYITLREGEERDLSELAYWSDGSGLGYTNERPQDRDHRGVLWTRNRQPTPVDAPAGAPQWSEVHPARQRAMMMTLRCQVCAAPARTRAGSIFLTGLRPNDRPFGEGDFTTQPPVCPRHAFVSAKRCPHLYEHELQVFLVQRPRLYGVRVTRLMPAPSGVLKPAPGDYDEAADAPVPYGDPGLPWMLATQLARQLREVTTVPLREIRALL